MIGQKYLLDFGITNPRVALLANGQEDSKGSLVTKEAFVLLKNSELNFVGNIEPYDIFMSNKVDLVICDGFSGNVLLKTLETTCKMTQGWCNWVIDNENDFKMRAVLELWFKKFSQNIELRFGYKKQGGAQLLGVSGNVIICHGNSDAYAIENAIKFAWNISNKK
jgi:glycerol-3-phosphate acyltransferase PlsX